jgi:hypothetical protein
MTRRAPILLVAGLLVATAAGFAVTQRLKLEPVAVSDIHVGRLFSPVCGCPTRTATIAFRLRRSDRVTLSVRDDAGDTVAVLARDRRLPRGDASFSWDGRSGGGVVPDGTYSPVVRLARAGRTIDLPVSIRVDTQPPRIAVAGGRGVPGKVSVRYRVSERAHVILFADGRRAVFTHRTRLRSVLDWYGRGAKPGPHRLSVVAVDLAGNRSAPVSFSVRLRGR